MTYMPELKRKGETVWCGHKCARVEADSQKKYGRKWALQEAGLLAAIEWFREIGSVEEVEMFEKHLETKRSRAEALRLDQKKDRLQLLFGREPKNPQVWFCVKERREQIYHAIESGVSRSKLAKKYNLTTERIHQIYRRAQREFEVEAA